MTAVPNLHIAKASENEFTPKGFLRDSSNPYYIGKISDSDDPDIFLHAHDDSFGDDNDPAFTLK